MKTAAYNHIVNSMCVNHTIRFKLDGVEKRGKVREITLLRRANKIMYRVRAAGEFFWIEDTGVVLPESGKKDIGMNNKGESQGSGLVG